MTQFRYFTTQRPPEFGAIPRGGLLEVDCYDCRTYVPEIDREAWGCVSYDRELSAQEVADFELAPAVRPPSLLSLRDMRTQLGWSQQAFGDYFGIPRRSIQNWESGERKCPAYVLDLIRYKLEKEGLLQGVQA